ncbi:MAG: hypothetical protein ABI273_14235 [Lacunisphaera sp.]
MSDAPQLPALWIWQGNSVAGCENWPAVQFWTLSVAQVPEKNKHMLIVDSAGVGWRLHKATPISPIGPLKRMFDRILSYTMSSHRWRRDPIIPVKVVLTGSVIPLAEVKKELIGLVEKEDDMFTEITPTKDLKMLILAAPDFPALFATLRESGAIQFVHLNDAA